MFILENYDMDKTKEYVEGIFGVQEERKIYHSVSANNWQIINYKNPNPSERTGIFVDPKNKSISFNEDEHNEKTLLEIIKAHKTIGVKIHHIDETQF